MKISKECLIQEAENTSFRPEILEKVFRLMDLLTTFMQDDFLASRIALKGGTALNLFYFEFPRLSVDIDINYIGSAEREIMLNEKEEVLLRIESILQEKNYELVRESTEHAGGKWMVRYRSNLIFGDQFEVNINFVTRVPLWPVERKDSFTLGSFSANNIPVMDIHELIGGKFIALFSRHSSQDLFDTNLLLTQLKNIDDSKLRIAFIVYGATNQVDWRNITLEQIQFDLDELQKMLLPMLRKTDIQMMQSPKQWAENFVQTCQQHLQHFLPLRENEIQFLKNINENGVITPELLTDDQSLCDTISKQSMLLWKARNVQRYFDVELDL